MKKSIFIAAALIALAACTREVEVNTSGHKMTITARTETSAETKTVVEGETHVYWEPGDEIKVFSGGKSGKFTTNITAPSASATFIGTLGDDAWMEGADLWAVYPYSEEAIFDGETITTVLPSEQVAREGSFGKDLNLSIAHSAGRTLQFYNVGGGVCFSVYNKGIKSVSLKAMNGESLSGKVQVSFDSAGKPAIKRIIEGADVVTVYAPGGEFKPGKTYFAILLPGELEDGLFVSYKDESCSAYIELGIPGITRSIYGKMGQKDEQFIFEEYAVPDRVNLGLSVMWGSFNLGATASKEYGQYYAWGESVPKTMYDWEYYHWGLGFKGVDIIKYCTDPLYGWNGYTDNLLTLDPDDDAARLILGEKWRIPTKEEWEELIDNCTRSLDWFDGVIGCRFTSHINGESIFLPAAGFKAYSSLDYDGSFGYYWTSTLYEDRPDLAYLHSFNTVVLNNWQIDGGPRHSGCSIRPVYDD